MLSIMQEDRLYLHAKQESYFRISAMEFMNVCLIPIIPIQAYNEIFLK